MQYFDYVRKSIKVGFVSLLICSGSNVFAQTSGVSPYSAYGLGDVSPMSFAQQLSMGDLSLPISDHSIINISNPATYGSIEYTMFDVGIQGRFLRINTDEGVLDLNNVKVRNIALAFPLVRNKWGFSIGVVPVSSVGYSLQDSEVIDSIGTVNYKYEGEGGLNQFYFGVGGKVWQKQNNVLSVGLNGSYVFGSVEKIRKAIYPSDQGFYHTRSRESLLIRDLSLDLGVHYETRLTSDSARGSVDLLLGANYRFGGNLDAEVNLLTENFILGTGDVEFPRDTIQFIDDEKGQVFIPESYSLGAALRFSNKLTVGAEFELRDWRKYSTTFDIEERSRAQMQRAGRYSFGLVYYPVSDPRKAPLAKYLSTVKYRLGFRYLDTYLQLNDQQLAQYGISFGLGLPLLKSRSNSWVNIGCELGERGTLESDLIKEQFINVYFGVSIAPLRRDRWFRKNKID